ncbi:MAG: tetratricopeptide repeat protein [Pseudohongiellaceae bacterium]
MQLTIDEALKHGVEAHKEGKIQEADRIYTAILQVAPTHPDVNHNMGVLAVSIGKIQEALPFFKTALEANDSIDQFWLSYSDALGRLNRMKDLKALIARAVQAGISASTLQLMEQSLPKHELASPSTDRVQADSYENKEPPLEQLQHIFTLYSKSQFHQAIGHAQALLKQFPDSAHLYNLIGSAHASIGSYDEALVQFERAIALNPKDASAHNNMGLALQNKGENHAAIRSFNQVLCYQPRQAETLSNLANSLKEIGDIQDAIENYNKALEIRPQFSVAATNLKSLEIQLLKTHFKISGTNTEELGLESLLEKDPKYQVYQAISDFLAGNFTSCSSHINNCVNLVTTSKAAPLTPKDGMFCQAYCTFLSQLININPVNQNSKSQFIYHIGESHCLSYAHSNIEIASKIYTVSPMITLGAKAHHFSVQEQNSYKAITLQNLSAMPQSSIVFVSFGEIDCRAEEGIILASKKTGREMSDIVNQTVTRFVKWLVQANETNQHIYYFFNVPAPVYSNTHSTESNAEIAGVVELFNSKLKTELLFNNIGMIDVYKHTKNENGFSNKKYHCDSRHLDVRILELIQGQL